MTPALMLMVLQVQKHFLHHKLFFGGNLQESGTKDFGTWTPRTTAMLLSCRYLGCQVTVVSGCGQRGEAEGPLAAGEGGRRLDEGRSVTEGAEASLLGEELLVGHGVDGVREGEGRADGGKTDLYLKTSLKLVQTDQTFILFPFEGEKKGGKKGGK